jgi:hypothetical protein
MYSQPIIENFKGFAQSPRRFGKPRPIWPGQKPS